jgi:hypothetical protein
MKNSLDLRNTQVFDDVLSQDDFNSLHTWYEQLPFVWRNSNKEWNKVWSTTDGEILISEKIFFNINDDLTKFDKNYLVLYPFMMQLKNLIPKFFGNNIGNIVMTPFIWPPGTGLSWHTDKNYMGAFTFYVHKNWNANWSGEFLTIEGDKCIPRPNNFKINVFDDSIVNEFIMNNSIGQFIYPKPNRLVFNRSGENGILHKVNKSSLQAKDRLTIQGFISYPENCGDDQFKNINNKKYIEFYEH